VTDWYLRETTSPRLVIPMMMAWVARNVVHSGLVRQLVENGIEPILLVPESPPEELAQQLLSLGVGLEALLEGTYQGGRIDWFVDAILSFAVIRRNAPDTSRLRRRWYERHMVGKPRSRYRTAAVLSAIFLNPTRYEWLRTFWERRRQTLFDIDRIARQLSRVQADAVWFSTWGVGKESPYVAAAQALGLPTVTSIISFDNVLTKGVRPRFHHYLVWSERIAHDLLRREGNIPPRSVSIVGTSQFDFHRRPELVWDRNTTLRQLGLPPEGRFFLYGAGRDYHSPGEIDLVVRVAARLEEDPRLANHCLVVRLHPLDDRERWQRLAVDQRIVVSDPFNPPVNEDGWSWSSLDDQALLVSSLHYADACLSVASTIALDAAIVGTPAIGLKFDREMERPREVYFDAFDLDHYRPLVESGGLWLARSWSDLTKLLKRTVENPQDGREERERMVADICGVVDGCSGDRTVRALSAFLNSAVRERTA